MDNKKIIIESYMHGKYKTVINEIYGTEKGTVKIPTFKNISKKRKLRRNKKRIANNNRRSNNINKKPTPDRSKQTQSKEPNQQSSNDPRQSSPKKPRMPISDKSDTPIQDNDPKKPRMPISDKSDTPIQDKGPKKTKVNTYNFLDKLERYSIKNGYRGISLKPEIVQGFVRKLAKDAGNETIYKNIPKYVGKPATNVSYSKNQIVQLVNKLKLDRIIVENKNLYLKKIEKIKKIIVD